MKKTICILLIALMVISMFGCSKKEEIVEEVSPSPVETEKVEEPVVQINPVPEATPEPAPTPEVDMERDFGKIVCSDADVDSVMNDDVAGWENYSVATFENPGNTVFYIIPQKDSENVDAAVGSVSMEYDENKVTKITCSVFATELAKQKDACKKVYEFFRDSFPLVAFGSVKKAAWEQMKETVVMDFDEACKDIEAGNLSEKGFGKFLYAIEKEAPVEDGEPVSDDIFIDFIFNT